MQNGSHHASCGAFPAMVQPVDHHMTGVYPPAQAIGRGTFFPELDKPMKGCRSSAACAATAQQALSFAAWEVRLYLNTHPQDQRALALYHDLCQQAGSPSYACAFAGCNQREWNWVDDPWPWEYAANARRD